MMKSRVVARLSFSLASSWIETSRELPKCCTMLRSTPACSSAERIGSRSTESGKPTSMTTPPRNSIPKFSPRVASDTSETTISNADIA